MRFLAPARHPAVWLAALAVIVSLGVSIGRTAEGGDPPDDGVAPGTVAFFAAGAACPVGWAPATEAAGRMVVGVTDPAAVGVTVGAPLGDREDRAHAHGYNGAARVPPRALAALDGPNNQGARAGTYPVTGTTAPARSGLPFVQLRACVRR